MVMMVEVARGRVAKFSSARVGVGEGAKRGEVMQPGDVRSSFRRAAAGEGAEAYDLKPGEVFGACLRGRRRGGLKLYQLRAAWGAPGQLSGIWLRLWVSAFGGAAQSATMLIVNFAIVMTFLAAVSPGPAWVTWRPFCERCC